MLQMGPKPHSISIMQHAFSQEPPVTPLQSFAEVVELLVDVLPVLVELVVAIPPAPPLPFDELLVVVLLLPSTSEPQAHTHIAVAAESPTISESLRIIPPFGAIGSAPTPKASPVSRMAVVYRDASAPQATPSQKRAQLQWSPTNLARANSRGWRRAYLGVGGITISLMCCTFMPPG